MTSPALEKFLAVRRSKCAFSGSWQPGWGYRRQGIMAARLPKGLTDPREAFEKYSPNFNIGKHRDALYNPNWGFEAYWADGDWVMTPFSNQTAEGNDFCNKKCSPLYIKYGTICARNREGQYRSFENYCKMAGADCDGGSGWTIVYQGECISGQVGGENGTVGVLNTAAKEQPAIKREIIERFYKKYSVGIGGGMVDGTTALWTHREIFTDYRRREEKYKVTHKI